MENTTYKEYHSIEEYIQDEVLPKCTGDPIEESALPMKAALKKMQDEYLRKRYRVRCCPLARFEPCKGDDCALFENTIPGLPWWGRCQLGRRGASI